LLTDLKANSQQRPRSKDREHRMAEQDSAPEVDPAIAVAEIVSSYVASPGRGRRARRIDCRGASGACLARACPARATPARGADPTLGPAGLCCLPRVWVSRAGTPPTSADRTRPRSGRLPRPLATPAGSPNDRAELFRAALVHGQGDRSRAPPRRRGAEPAGNRAADGSASRSPAETPAAGDVTFTVLRCRKVPQIAPPRARSASRGTSRGVGKRDARRRNPAAIQIMSI
jgi:hypothetical protein